MKKVGILTTHASMNYGGLLQAYALRRVIQKQGHDCDIVNYVPDMQNAGKNPIQFITKRKGFVSKAMLATAHYSAYKERMKILNDFREDYLSPNPQEALGYEELKRYVDNYDLICCGSDQIWNLNLKDMENGAYMLNFPHDVPAFSYAVSFGDGLTKAKEAIEQNLGYIQKFSKISVREDEGKEFLSSHGIEAEVSIDPTLLLDRGSWKKLAGKKPKIRQPYIFLYGFDSAYQRLEDLVKAANRLSKELGMPVVNALMVPKLARAGFLNMYRCGPIEFLNLIRHSSYVCTNSFHATVFSYVYEKPFSVITSPGMGLDGRKETLLSILGLRNRFMDPGDRISRDQLLDCSFDQCGEELKKMREESIEYLRGVIGE